MTIRQRLTQAWQGLRTVPEPAAGVSHPVLKVRRGSIPNLWPDYRNATPLWTMTDVQSFVEHGYNINAVIYAACQYRADAIVTAQLRAYQGDQDQHDALSTSDPLARLLVRPNQFQSAHEFHALNSVFFALAGQSYIWFTRARTGDVPSAMYTLRPDWVHIVPGNENGQAVIGYVYAPEGTALSSGYPLLPEDVMHVKRPNPGDPIMGAGYGFSPMNALAQSGNVDNDVTRFLKTFFQSGAMFQNAVTFEGERQPEELAMVRERLKEIYGGVDNWNEWAVFDSSAKVTRVSPTFDEMGFDAIDARNEARMLMALGVPPILVGARLGLERSTFSNYEEARRAFWEDRLLPELRMFEGEFNYYLTGGDTFIRYDLSDVPALRRDIPALSVAAKTLYDMGVPPRIAFTTVGLEVPEYEGDQDSKPAPVNPFGAIAAPAQKETPEQPTEGEALEGTASKARKINAPEGYAVLYLDRVDDLLSEQQRAIQEAESRGIVFKPTQRDELHITLVYAESIDDNTLQAIGSAIRRSDFPRLSLSSTQMAWFGQDEGQKALVYRVENQALRDMQRSIYELFATLDPDGTMLLSEFSIPDDFKAHVTLGYSQPFEISPTDVNFDAAQIVCTRDGYQRVMTVVLKSKTRVTKAYDAATMQRKMDTLAVNWEKRYGDQAAAVFQQERRTLSAMLTEMQKSAYARKASPDWRSLIGTVADWYAKTQPETWRSAFVPLLEGVMLETGKEWAATLGIQFDVRNLRAETWFQEYALKFAQPITQTSSDTVKAVLEQALAEGWSIQDTDKRLAQVFEQWTKGDLSAEDFAWFEQRMPPYRRELIARVESMRSANNGANSLFKEWGVKEREWIATSDDRTRDTHLEANGQRQPIDEPFSVGGYPMMYPLDMELGAPPEEAMNCRCTVGAIVE